MTRMLEVRDLSIAFNDQLTVQGVSFDLEAGESLALVGESGSGKSITALSILQLLPYPIASHPAGSIRLDGDEVVNQPQTVLRKLRGDKVAMIFQEPMTSLNPLHTIGKQIGEILYLHQGLGKAAARARIIELLELVGIPEPERRLASYPHELSGGQRQRVMIAMALANEPELLIADEPTTALDVTIQAQIMELLRSLQKKLNMAILFITHDLNLARQYVDRLVVMEKGRVVEQGKTEQIFTQPSHTYTRELLDAEPSGQAHPLSSKQLSQALLDCKDIKVHFPLKKGFWQRTYDYFRAVDGIDLKLRPGETLGIVGESGSGKSTLAQAILGLTQSRGEIHFDGNSLHDLNEAKRRPYRRRMQIVFQDPFGSLSPRLSVAQIVAEGLEVHAPELTPEQVEARVHQALTDVGMDPDAASRYPHEFSGGQRQRIAIARALILQPELLVLDEPTSALDRTVQRQVLDLLRDLQRRYGLSYLFISHDLAVIRVISHRVMVMKAGQVVEQGETETIFNTPQSDYTQDLLAAAMLTNQ